MRLIFSSLYYLFYKLEVKQMIQIKAEYAEAYIKKQLEEQFDQDYLLIFDVDDLHDYTIEYSEDIEMVYWALYAVLPVIFDNVMNYLDSIQDFQEICDSQYC